MIENNNVKTQLKDKEFEIIYHIISNKSEHAKLQKDQIKFLSQKIHNSEQNLIALNHEIETQI